MIYIGVISKNLIYSKGKFKDIPNGIDYQPATWATMEYVAIASKMSYVEFFKMSKNYIKFKKDLGFREFTFNMEYYDMDSNHSNLVIKFKTFTVSLNNSKFDTLMIYKKIDKE